MLKNSVILTLLIFVVASNCCGQTCKERTVKQLQGIWIDEDRKDTTLLIVNDNKFEIHYKHSRNWDNPYFLNITNNIPQIIDTIIKCGFIETTNLTDTNFYKIVSITDTTLKLVKYSFLNSCFLSDGDIPLAMINKRQLNYRKTNLRRGYNLRAPVFGEWADEDTNLFLKPDSTFSIVYSTGNYMYSTCGKFSFDGEHFTLIDYQNKQQVKNLINCDHLNIKAIEAPLSIKQNKYILFDVNNEIHIYFGWAGLWLQETCMILTKMSK